MIEVQGLSKRYGAVQAVDDLTFTVQPGHVTGFLGPNGAGKSTTMRMIVGLDKPTSGTALIDDAQSLEATIYSSPEADVRDVWVVDLGDVRLLVKGEAGEDEFRELLATTVATEPLPAT